jgi:hypothetical protein
MLRAISEADWKPFRQLLPIALERFCQRVLAEIDRISADTNQTYHQRYLAACKLIEMRDSEMTAAFNDLRRSTALRQLVCIQSYELLTEEEMSGFSPETRAAVQFLVGELRT